MEKLITFGFLIPPDGKPVDLSKVYRQDTAHMDYCKEYIHETDGEPYWYNVYREGPWYHARENDPYSDYCMQVLGWCRAGNIFPEKTIYLSGAFAWHEKVIEEYQKAGYTIEFCSSIELANKLGQTRIGRE